MVVEIDGSDKDIVTEHPTEARLGQVTGQYNDKSEGLHARD